MFEAQRMRYFTESKKSDVVGQNFLPSSPLPWIMWRPLKLIWWPRGGARPVCSEPVGNLYMMCLHLSSFNRNTLLWLHAAGLTIDSVTDAAVWMQNFSSGVSLSLNASDMMRKWSHFGFWLQLNHISSSADCSSMFLPNSGKMLKVWFQWTPSSFFNSGVSHEHMLQLSNQSKLSYTIFIWVSFQMWSV